ncbi:hypothetical protein [Burkholderia sp. Ac-20353]|uniref:hypothetical protein n=1 Tax=Burkholderia sp. Ac-20353 TaxID=2703894 RepID=UPI00197CA4E8|nr:hypothetical protein [Burkholderia sp. Ac-20353]MBN3789872.1 hypothetical protein [Burkholderia sp. Ac-20353]
MKLPTVRFAREATHRQRANNEQGTRVGRSFHGRNISMRRRATVAPRAIAPGKSACARNRQSCSGITIADALIPYRHAWMTALDRRVG